jgi:hypothetical protein
MVLNASLIKAIGFWLASVACAAYVINWLFYKPAKAGCLSIFLIMTAFPLLKVFIFQAIYFSSVYIKNKGNDAAENRVRLEAVLKKQKPFALFLRNYSTEEGSTVLTIMPGNRFEVGPDRPLGLMYWPVENNMLENSVVDEISQFIPVFALLNRKDASVGSAYRIEVPESENWYGEFEKIAITAKLIIMVAEKETEGIMQELHWIDTHNIHSRLVLITSKQFNGILKERIPGFIDKVEWTVIPTADPYGSFRLSMLTVPSTLLSHVKALSENYGTKAS